MWLRVNRQRGTREAYLAQLAAAGIARRVPTPTLRRRDPARAGRARRHAARFRRRRRVGAGRRRAGAWPTRWHCAPGPRVLDACAAPGGKTAHLLERDAGAAAHRARHRPARLRRSRDTLARVGVARSRAAAGRRRRATPDAWWDGARVRRRPARCAVLGHRHRAPPARRAAAPPRQPTSTRCSRCRRACSMRCGPRSRPAACCSTRRARSCATRTSARSRPSCAHRRTPRPMPLDARFGRDSGAGRPALPGEDGWTASSTRGCASADPPRRRPARRPICIRRCSRRPNRANAGCSGWSPCWCSAPASGCATRGPRTSRVSRWSPGRWSTAGSGCSRCAATSCTPTSRRCSCGCRPAAYALFGNWRVAFLLPSLLAALGTLALRARPRARLWTRRVGVYAAWALLFTLHFTFQARRRRSTRCWCSGSRWPCTACCATCCAGPTCACGGWAGSPPGWA